MKILLLSPGLFEGYKPKSIPVLYPRLGLRILAALTPETHQVKILEGREADSPPFDEEVDLVGISVLTPHANTAYRVADAFRKRGRTVVLGGPHATGAPKEAKQHADAVAMGEGEYIWPTILQDFERGTLKPFYQSKSLVDPAEIPTPVSLDSDSEYYASGFPIESGRGCSCHCKFCVVPNVFGGSFRSRPLGRVVEEIEMTKRRANGKLIVIFSENLFGNPGPALELAERVAPLEVDWGAEGDLLHVNQDSYLDTLKQSNCTWIYVETKMPSKKREPKVFQIYKDAVARILDRGIFLSLNLTIGFDNHDESIVDDVQELLLKRDLAPYGFIQLLVPWPGTPLFEFLDSQGRIVTRDWRRYTNLDVVFKPKMMSRQRLSSLFEELLQELNNLKSAALGEAMLRMYSK